MVDLPQHDTVKSPKQILSSAVFVPLPSQAENPKNKEEALKVKLKNMEQQQRTVRDNILAHARAQNDYFESVSRSFQPNDLDLIKTDNKALVYESRPMSRPVPDYDTSQTRAPLPPALAVVHNALKALDEYDHGAGRAKAKVEDAIKREQASRRTTGGWGPVPSAAKGTDSGNRNSHTGGTRVDQSRDPRRMNR